MFHPLTGEIVRQLPQTFTYPFCYTPHPLCIHAAKQVQEYLVQQKEWQEELSKGKMFGVLIVQTQKGEVGYLAAFSGILAGKNLHAFFVPPVYDLLQPDGFFKLEEEQISAINRRIQALEQHSTYLSLQETVKRLETEMTEALSDLKQQMKIAKEKREAVRKSGILTSDETKALIRESQFQKAEYKRQERAWREQLELAKKSLNDYETEILQLKTERKERSATLQHQLFEQFVLLNANSERRSLCDIFINTPSQTPPAGAGECAAPKLLQYAYLHQLRPIAMAEFWWGASPKGEIRHHGHFYPACKGKCGPILAHMLQGLTVEKNPLATQQQQMVEQLKIVYEDEYLLLVNKPAGMLTVPGKENDIPSVYSLLRHQYPEAEEPMIVHRLDMDTSGLLLIAKKRWIHKALQKQFVNHTVRKRYVALLCGVPKRQTGEISLPLCPNVWDRPRQMVSFQHGKPAVTEFQVLSIQDEYTRIAFYPQTGRTHQLRLHAAHPDGLGCPIRGDILYGRREERLYLHAEWLSFIHPATGNRLEFTQEADF